MSADRLVEEAANEASLQPVEAAYVKVIFVRTVIGWVPPVIGAAVLDRLVLADTAFAWVAPFVMALLALGAVLVAPRRIWLRLGYALEPRMLRVVRGWMWQVDTLVPLARVQHLDIARSPLDKAFGTASLVVHTAGTHNSVVALPGLSPTRADELATIIRGHVNDELD